MERPIYYHLGSQLSRSITSGEPLLRVSEEVFFYEGSAGDTVVMLLETAKFLIKKLSELKRGSVTPLQNAVVMTCLCRCPPVWPPA